MISNDTKEYKLPESKFGLGSDHTDMIVFLIKYFRIVSMVFLVWVIGYWNFSIAWILLAVFLYMLRERNNSARNIRAEMIKAIGINEKDATLARIDDVPSWVFFPDKERAEWMNKFLKQIWPYLKLYLSKTIVESVEPIINQFTTSLIGKIKFEKIDLGDTAPRIASIKVYTEHIPQGEIMFDIEVLYAGDANLKLVAKKIVAGVKDIQFHGDFRVILKPLCNRIPFFASLTVFMLKMPQIDFNLTDIANTFDLPGLRDLIDNIIVDSVSKTLVLPNRLVLPIIPDFDMAELEMLKSIKPKGVFRIHVVRGINLKNSDLGLIGRGKSDPYVKISGIGVPKKTKVINNNLNPIWNETFNFLIDYINPNPTLLLEVYDKDELHDDFIGNLDVNIETILPKGKEEGSYKLKNVRQGELYLKFEYFTLSTNKAKLEEIRNHKSFKMQQSTCLLLVDIKSASDLAFSYKRNGGMIEPDPRLILSIGDETAYSAVKEKTINPKWNETVYMFIENPFENVLLCTVEDEKTNNSIGRVEISLREILNEENLNMERSFSLNSLSADAQSKLNLKLSLFILCPKRDDNTSSNSPQEEMINLGANKRQITRSNSNLSINNYAEKYLNGHIRLSMKYLTTDGVFLLTIFECRNLKMSHHSHLPDPYVKVFLLPDKKSKKKTRSIKGTINPVYEERIQWTISLNDLKKRQLCLTVKNDKSLFSNEKVFMGQIVINFLNLEPDVLVEKWYHLKDKNEAKFFLDYCESLIDRMVPI